MGLSPQFLDELRARTSLSAVVGRTVKLQRAGREWKAPCPFHNEKTPSFYVNDEKGFYHCFGCGVHGDAIRWLTDAGGLPFMEAVKELADHAGMEVPAPDPRAQEKAEQAAGLHDVMEAAQNWFEAQLGEMEGAQARSYLETRGVSEATRRRFGFGYAPDSRGKLKAALKAFGNDKLIEAGLLIRPEDEREPYDRFRGRLTFPIRDVRGRVIAFSARILAAGEPKYLNSPDTPLFDKGRTLFNLDKAGPASRAAKRVLVVEGQMDVIALDQAGIPETLAPLGTAVTEAQLQRLWQLSDVPIFCLDGDIAGQRAAARAARRALPILGPNKSLAFVQLPHGEDPDDVVRRGGAAEFEQLVARPKPLVKMLYESEVDNSDVGTPEGRAGLRNRLSALAGSCSDRILQDEYRRSLNGLFWDEFGWKREERKKIASSILKTGPRGNRHLMNLFVRSALYGLSCFPQVVVAHAGAVAEIRMDHSELLRWRETLVEAAIVRPSLDADAVQNILETTRLSGRQSHDMRYDLRFPHQRIEIEPVEAMRRLTGLVDFLVREHNLDEEMARLNAAAVNDPAMESYDAIELQRQLLREHRLALIDEANLLGERNAGTS
jgi:DNA primase